MVDTFILEQAALAISGEAVDTEWNNQDDLCDCTFQRIGFWTNPYIGKTLLVRFCCIWERFHQEYPEYVREVNNFWNYNENHYEPEARPWDSNDSSMPRSIWYRQLATQTGKTLAEIRAEYGDQETPRKVTI